MARNKQGRRIDDFGETASGHLEDADLMRRAEPVLERAQDAEIARAFALKGDDRIDHMLDDAGSGDLPVLGDMADENDGGARRLGVADQRLRRAAHLRHRAGDGIRRHRSTWSGWNR